MAGYNTVTVLPVEIGALRWMPGLLIALVIALLAIVVRDNRAQPSPAPQAGAATGQAPLEAGPHSPTRSEAAAGASP